jgi:hypothetical protein
LALVELAALDLEDVLAAIARPQPEIDAAGHLHLTAEVRHELLTLELCGRWRATSLEVSDSLRDEFATENGDRPSEIPRSAHLGVLIRGDELRDALVKVSKTSREATFVEQSDPWHQRVVKWSDEAPLLLLDAARNLVEPLCV